MRGRKPKPIALRVGEGDRRKLGRHKLAAKLNSVPNPSHGLPDCPRHLRGRARTQWDLWREELEGMTLDARPDGAALEAACINYATAIKAHLKLEREGEVISEPIVARDHAKILGYRLKKNPWLNVRDRAFVLLAKFCSEFGFTPSSRVGLSVVPPSDSYADIHALLSGPSLTEEEKKKLQ